MLKCVFVCVFQSSTDVAVTFSPLPPVLCASVHDFCPFLTWALSTALRSVTLGHYSSCQHLVFQFIFNRKRKYFLHKEIIRTPPLILVEVLKKCLLLLIFWNIYI